MTVHPTIVNSMTVLLMTMISMMIHRMIVYSMTVPLIWMMVPLMVSVRVCE
jgi:hypothetical protein